MATAGLARQALFLSGKACPGGSTLAIARFNENNVRFGSLAGLEGAHHGCPLDFRPPSALIVSIAVRPTSLDAAVIRTNSFLSIASCKLFSLDLLGTKRGPFLNVLPHHPKFPAPLPHHC